ncbi:MAG: hypothetical protein M3N93_11170 [Acidobacteriota bacterium]|nr:hypothetical protein [Acidobacteriota bacterium]
MNAPWYPEDQIDWLDGLNPLRLPAFREARNPYVYRALQSATMVQLRAAHTYEPALYAAPDETFQVLPAGITYDSITNLPAGAWIIGVSAASTQPEGFLAQVTLPTGATLFGKPIGSKNLTAKPYYLSEPLGLPDGGPVKLRLVNQSINPNACQLVLWGLRPA